MAKLVAGRADGQLFATTSRTLAADRSPATVKAAFDPNIPADLSYEPPESMRSIKDRARIGLDIEGHDPQLQDLGPGAHRRLSNGEWEGKICGVAIAYGERDAQYYPTSHASGNMQNPEQFYNQLRDEAKTFEGEIVGANLQYDLDWLRARHDIRFDKAKIRDVQTAEPLLDENRMTYKLAVLARDYLGSVKKSDQLESLYGKGYIRNMHKVHACHAAPYGMGDTMLPWSIYDKQKIKLEEEGLTDLFEMESKLTPLLLEMRAKGVRVDIEKAAKARTETEATYLSSLEEIRQLSQSNVEIWSADSIAIAFDNLGLSYPSTKTGKPSFKKDWLKAHDSEIARLIVNAREYEKIGSTFIQSYILDGHINGRLHCMFNQLKSDGSGTVSGRFSSSGPNLQNIPARHPVLGPLMRSMFIPEEGMLWGSLDWSQIEYRLLVHYASQMRGVDAAEAVRMYNSDPKTDFHNMASELTGVPRKQVKSINFGVVYGMGVPTLAKSLGVSLQEARDLMRQFHDAAPFIKSMLERTSAVAAHRGWIKTILGRKRRFNAWEANGDIFQSYDDAVKAGGRAPRRAFTHKALNSLLQGSAADLMKKAMVEMWEGGLFDVLVPHLTVHDEFNSSVPNTREGMEAFNEMRHIMETSLSLDVPVLADGTTGTTWDEAK